MAELSLSETIKKLVNHNGQFGDHPDDEKDLAAAMALADQLQRDVQQCRHKLWMVACHATGGGIPEIEGIDRSTNDICVQITQSRNTIYQAGKDAALATQPATSQEGEVKAWLYQREGCASVVAKNAHRWANADGWVETPLIAALATQPATSQEGEDEDVIHDCGNLGWCQAPGYCSRHDIAALATQPDDRN